MDRVFMGAGGEWVVGFLGGWGLDGEWVSAWVEIGGEVGGWILEGKRRWGVGEIFWL